MGSRRSRRHESGQALIEAALTFPLSLFVFLGTLQLFLMYHARLTAEYAAFRAVRAGVTNHGNCDRMRDAALVAVLPSLRTVNPGNVGAAYRALAADAGNLLWMDKALTDAQGTSRTFAGFEDEDFDNPDVGPTRLNVQLVFWYRLRIPFADWVLMRMMMAYWGIMSYQAANPLMPIKRANWGTLRPLTNGALASEIASRYAAGRYEIPITARYAMRMMTPAKAQFAGNCR